MTTQTLIPTLSLRLVRHSLTREILHIEQRHLSAETGVVIWVRIPDEGDVQ